MKKLENVGKINGLIKILAKCKSLPHKKLKNLIINKAHGERRQSFWASGMLSGRQKRK